MYPRCDNTTLNDNIKSHERAKISIVAGTTDGFLVRKRKGNEYISECEICSKRHDSRGSGIVLLLIFKDPRMRFTRNFEGRYEYLTLLITLYPPIVAQPPATHHDHRVFVVCLHHHLGEYLTCVPMYCTCPSFNLVWTEFHHSIFSCLLFYFTS